VDVAAVRPYEEVRFDEEDERLRSLSESTLWYMHDAFAALGERLRGQEQNLGFIAEEEYDLVRAMRLSARLASVSSNIGATERTVGRVRSEIVRRAAEA
jgi:hypothetical protein